MKIITKALSVIILLLSSFGLSGCLITTEYDSAVNYLKRNLDIEVPNNSRLLRWYQDDNFQGVHETYIVFEFAKEASEWLNGYGFVNSKDEGEKQSESKERFENDLRHRLDNSRETSRVEANLLPDFEREYYYLLARHKDNGPYVDYLLFYPDTNVFICYRPYV